MLRVVVIAFACSLASCAQSDQLDGSGGGGLALSTVTGGGTGATKSATSSAAPSTNAVVSTTQSSTSGNGLALCGNGVIDPPSEECDDGNDVDGDGCTGCAVDCAANEEKDASTFHCYRVVTTSAAWIGAQADCVAWGGAPGLGNLAVVTSAAESSFIGGMITEKAWIGGTDSAQEGTWTWIDAEPWAFTAWEPGEPNNGNNEDCAIMKVGGKWDDHPCGNGYHYVCERGAAGE